MLNRRVLFLCVILAASAAILQSAPRILGDAFAFAVLLCGLPVYIAARLNCTLGIIVYLAAAAISAYANISEALFFTCTNGIIGLSLGINKRFFRNWYTAPVTSVILVIFMLSMVNCILGISIFNNTDFKTHIAQMLMIFPPLYIYCLVYLKLSIFADNLLHRNIELGDY